MVALTDCSDDSKSSLVNLREEYKRDMKLLTDENIQVIVDKQFEMVGAKAPPFKDLGREWFLERSWGANTESAFTDWLSEYFQKLLKISKRKANYEALAWVFNYGFKQHIKSSVTEKD